MVILHNTELHELAWSNVYSRPDLQVRAMLLMSQDNYKKLFAITSLDERINMMDAAYNGGMRDVMKQRMQCGLTPKCNPQIWFNNVASICVKSLKPLYCNKSACDINREHVYNIRYLRMNKYKPYFNGGVN